MGKGMDTGKKTEHQKDAMQTTKRRRRRRERGMEEGKGGAPVNSRNLHRKLEARLIHRVYSCAASQVYIYITFKQSNY